MKKLFLFSVLVCFSACGFLSAQTNDEKSAAFQLGFFPPLSTNGKEASHYTNHVSFNILAGISRNERIFTFGGLGNIIGENASGVQFAGLGNIIGKNAEGLQFAGLVNIAGGNASGIQFSGLGNVTGGTSSGLQFSGITNIIGGSGKGLLFSGIGNVTHGAYKGVQFSGIGNIGDDISGVQFGGIFNIAKNVKGTQIAALVNIAENSDYPVGLVNIIKNGEKSIGVTYDQTGSSMVSFRSGGRVLYGILGVGYNHKTDDEPFVAEGGFGAHISVVERFRINAELKNQYMTSFSNTHVLLSSFSILPAFRICPFLEVFAGPSLIYGETDNIKNKNLFPGHDLWKKEKNDRSQQLFVGYTFGIQYIF
ncbi:MAG: hypothetical protein LUG18_06735 [Candidatus Azobacteroides sp.]|nr:hypothetical protein [Candidatus Azobacteroides sp.]